ncbi:MAG: hypothetical protein N2C14_00795, partial [Planctomycetales bacterium]
MNRFSQVKVFLDESINGQAIGAHGAFWRGKTRNEFVAFKVFGVISVVTVGDGANSNLIKRLRGDGVSRMPPSPFDAMPSSRIDFIEQWIEDGAPSELSDAVAVDAAAGGSIDPRIHNTYWREFDNWALFHPSTAAQAATGQSFQHASHWADFARGNITAAELTEEATNVDVAAAIQLLANRQMHTVESVYGNSVPLLTLLEGYELFGRGVANDGLPPDPLRPSDPNHQMNGPRMWFNWCAMADACLRQTTPIHPEFWRGHMRAILLGLLNDGVIRERFPVDGFSKADPQVAQKMKDHVIALNDNDLQAELASRFKATALNLPF